MKHELNIQELAKILNFGETTLYAYFDKELNNKNYKINLKKLLIKSKIYDFKFINEDSENFFYERFIKKLDVDKYNNMLIAREVFEISGFDYNKLYYLRKHDLIEYKITNEKYNKHKFEYNKDSIMLYMSKKGILPKNDIFILKKQFYKTSEAIKYIHTFYNIDIAEKTFYRYINEYKVIPAIKIGRGRKQTIRIPILEFEKINFREVFQKKPLF